MNDSGVPLDVTLCKEPSILYYIYVLLLERNEKKCSKSHAAYYAVYFISIFFTQFGKNVSTVVQLTINEGFVLLYFL